MKPVVHLNPSTAYQQQSGSQGEIDACFRSHEELGEPSTRFLRFAVSNDELCRPYSFDLSSVAGLGDPSDFVLQSWPMIASDQFVSQLSETAIQFVDALRAASAEAFVSFDDKAMRAHGPEYRLTKHTRNIARLDIVHTEDGLKIVELNTHGALGGWQPYCFTTSYLERAPIAEFVREHSCWRFEPMNSLDRLIEHLVHSAIGYAQDDAAARAAIMVPEKYAAGARQFADNAKDHIATLTDADIEIHVISPHSNLSISDASLFHDVNRIHAVLVFSMDCDLPVEIQLAEAENRFCILNNRALRRLGAKSILPELRAYAELHEEKYPLVRDAIPETALLNSPEGHDMLSKGSRSDFVIKPAIATHGDNVFIGSNLRDHAWKTVVESVSQVGDFVIQEYCPSRPYLAQCGEKGYTVHDVVWGVFVYGATLGGISVRMLPKNDLAGVVNVCRGATESIVLRTSLRE